MPNVNGSVYVGNVEFSNLYLGSKIIASAGALTPASMFINDVMYDGTTAYVTGDCTGDITVADTDPTSGQTIDTVCFVTSNSDYYVWAHAIYLPTTVQYLRAKVWTSSSLSTAPHILAPNLEIFVAAGLSGTDFYIEKTKISNVDLTAFPESTWISLGSYSPYTNYIKCNRYIPTIRDCVNLKTVEIVGQSMIYTGGSYRFYNCPNITTITGTLNGILNASYMFAMDNYLFSSSYKNPCFQSPNDFDGFDFDLDCSTITNASAMFEYNVVVKSITASFDSLITRPGSSFIYHCNRLETVDLSFPLLTTSVAGAESGVGFLRTCLNLKNIKITAAKMTSLAYLLYRYTETTMSRVIENVEIDAPLATSLSYFCAYNESPFSGTFTINCPSVTNMSYAFRYASNFNKPINIPSATNWSYAFSYASNFNKPINIPSATNCSNAFSNTALNATNANAIMTSLPTMTDGNVHTITFTGSPCCADAAFDPTIATAKGWTVQA